jgi:hypothetical protein
MQRRPPQIGPMGPGGSGQSALLAQGSALALLQVSHAHFSPMAPVPVQFGLVLVIACAAVAVERSTRSERVATSGVAGGQSRLVTPKSGWPGTSPFASQPSPPCLPPTHTPAAMPSFAVPSPTQIGHGAAPSPAYTRQRSMPAVASSPVSTFTVPEIVPSK